MRRIYLLLYYAVASRLPMQPFPGGYLFNKFRFFLVSKIIRECGREVMVKDRCYFGDGSRISVGDYSQLGQNAHLVGTINIGREVLMGPDVVMMATSHEYARIDISMMSQGEAPERPINIGSDVWLGTRVIILPGVNIGDHSIVAAGAVVTRSFPPFAIIGGVPARQIGTRAGATSAVRARD